MTTVNKPSAKPLNKIAFAALLRLQAVYAINVNNPTRIEAKAQTSVHKRVVSNFRFGKKRRL
jgi:hypothetical protein